MSTPFLMTKLLIPLPGKYLVERMRLLEKLDQCLDPGCRLALISAPAGFGKTTLISTWVSALKTAGPERAVAWLSIDEGDNDPAAFWTVFISALQAQQSGIGQQALDLLAMQGSSLEGKLASFINDLVQIPHPCVVVLDDYHLIRNPVIHQSLSFFIEHIPPHVHLVMASRTDPPLPLALLRGRGQLLELRLNDLRFTNEDAERYLNASIGLNLAAKSVQALNQKTEGWIAGLQLASISLRDLASLQNQEKVEDFVASFSGSTRYILDFLIEEVLNRQPESIQNFLMRTSILDRLCGPLCDALLNEGQAGSQPGAQSVLEYLENSNLFILPLDSAASNAGAASKAGAVGCWYRYHQLFADLLRKRLTQTAPEMIPELHRKAMHWFEQNGLIPSAIQHAFQLRDFHQAAALVARIAEEMWGRGEHATLLAWLDALPEEEKKQYPHLLTFQVSMLISAGRLQEAEACIPILESYIRASLAANPGQTSLIGSVSALRTYIASFYGDKTALFSHARSALDHLTRDEDAGQRCGVSLVLANAYLTDGALESASQALVEAIAAGKKARKPHMALTGLANLTIVLLLQGSLKKAAQVCQEGLQWIQQNGLNRSPMAADLWIGWGEILCERGELEEAGRSIQRGLEIGREQNYLWQVAWGCQAQARLLFAQGNLAEAEAAVQAVEPLANRQEIPLYIACGAIGWLARIWIDHGKTGKAEQVLRDRQCQVESEIQFPHQAEYLALSRLLLLRGDLAAAEQLLQRVLDGSEANPQTGVLISTLLLAALVERARGDLQRSMQRLEQALALAEPEGYLQTFVEEGRPLADLLAEAVNQDLHGEYARRLLASFPGLPAGEPQTARPATEPEKSRLARSEKLPLAEPLSKREMEILQLIAEGHSNKEIAQRLWISLRTVKYYSTGLYNKLGVDSRMQAVIRARELGLL